MPGFIASIGNSIQIPEENNERLLISTLQGDGYQISRRTCKKFLNDKIVEDNDRFLLLIEGVIVNSRELARKYNAADWKDCVLQLHRLDPDTFYKEFRGSFCGCVHEKDTGRWTFFTDQIGAKQIFYACLPGGFVVGTEISYMADTLKANGVALTLDRDAAYMDLTLGYVIEDKTLFKEIHKLCAGHFLTLTGDNLQEKQYHRFSNKPTEMTPANSQFSLSTLRSFTGTKLSSVHPTEAATGVKASIHSSPCELSMEMEPVDDVILSNSSFDDAGSVGL